MMVITPLSLIVGMFTLPVANPAPKMETDYSVACKVATKEKKPLVVFLGHGKAGVEQTLPKGFGDATKVIDHDFVALYVDVDSNNGKELAQQFAVDAGVVISDRSGNLQALRHDGPINPEELKGYLAKYSDPNVAITTTELGGKLKVSTPVTVSSPYMTIPSYNIPQSTCPNCRK